MILSLKKEPKMGNLKVGVFCVLLSGVFVAWGKSYWARPGITDWTTHESFYHGDDPDKKSKPEEGDTVYITSAGDYYLDASSPSWALVNSLEKIVPTGTARLVVTVASETATLQCPVADFSVGYDKAGSLVKMGSGTLVLEDPGEGIFLADYTTHAFDLSIDVQEGVLKLPQQSSSTHFMCQNVNVAAGATLYTFRCADETLNVGVGGNTTVLSLSGAGTVIASPDKPVRRLRISGGASSFSGSLQGGVQPWLLAENARADFTGVESTFSVGDSAIVLAGKGGTMGFAKFWAGAGMPSSMGNTEFVRAQAVSNRVVYLGAGNETTKMGVNVSYSPLIIDAGATGGVTFAHGHEWCGTYGSSTTFAPMQYLVLTGSNTLPCVFRPYIRCWTDNISGIAAEARTNANFYITKSGSGTWRFEPNLSSTQSAKFGWCGGFCAEEGVSQFTALTEVNANSSFGYGTMAQRPYRGQWSPTNDVAYQLALGGTAAVPTLEYVGSNIVNVATRRLGVHTQGRLVNSSGTRFEFSGVMAAGPGQKELILDGTNQTQDTVRDITDGPYGGVMNVTKRGSGDWVLGGELTFSGKLKVEDGTLYVNDGRSWRWFKFTATATDTWKTTYGDFALYDVEGNRVNVGMTGDAFRSEDTSDATSNVHMDYIGLKPNRAALGRYDYCYDRLPHFDYTKSVSQIPNSFTIPATGLNGLNNLFNDTAASNDSGAFTVYNRTTISVGNTTTSHWSSVFMHLKHTASAVASYDWVVYKAASAPPKTWFLDASVDGINWTRVHTQDTAVDFGDSVNCWSKPEADGKFLKFASNQKRTGYPIAGPSQVPSAQLTQTMVAVKAGASLVFEGSAPTLSRLEISTLGAGTIDNAAFAAAGTLNVTDVTPGEVHELTGTYVNCTGVANLGSWQLTIDDHRTSYRLRMKEGRLTVMPPGLTVNFR